jgi:hypothetical protein
MLGCLDRVAWNGKIAGRKAIITVGISWNLGLLSATDVGYEPIVLEDVATQHRSRSAVLQRSLSMDP